MTEKRAFRFSLRFKILAVTLLCLVLCVLSFFIAMVLGEAVLQKVYLSDEKIAARQDVLLEDFSAYVEEYQLPSTDSDSLSAWSLEHRYATLYIFNPSGEHLRSLTSSGTHETRNSLGNANASKYSAAEGSRLVKFRDGVFRVQIEDGSENFAYAIELVIGVIAALFPPLLLAFWYSGTLTLRVGNLSRQAEKAGADLNNEVVMPGRDELASLAASVNDMRLSVIRQMRSENEAWRMNSELVTAMSHDIRTPMTSLLGYLDLVSTPEACTAEEAQQYLRSARSKALELKDLTDKLFRYAIVFGKDESFLQNELLEADFLFGQLLVELEFDLTESGFTVEKSGTAATGLVKLDPLQLKRVFENILSNARKYASREKPVLIRVDDLPEQLWVRVENEILRESEPRESNRIGMKACARLLEMMGGEFTVSETGDRFLVTILVPKVTETSPEEKTEV